MNTEFFERAREELGKLPWLAKEAIARELSGRRDWPSTPPTLVGVRAATFVTLLQGDGSLRGCVGTLRPMARDLWVETCENARKAAFHDSRFNPVDDSEIISLVCEVSVLAELEDIPQGSNLDYWLDPSVFGLVAQQLRTARSGVLLPGLPEVTTWKRQLEICRLKGGIPRHGEVKLRRFRVSKFPEKWSSAISIA